MFITNQLLTHSLTLLLQTMPNGVVITQSEHVTTAIFLDMQNILCNLPDRDTTAAMLSYDISVANDGGQYAAAKKFAFYDARCMACDAQQTYCTTKVHT